MFLEARKQSVAWMKHRLTCTCQSKDTYFWWKTKLWLEILGTLWIMVETAPLKRYEIHLLQNSLQELWRNFHVWFKHSRKLRRLSREHISKNSLLKFLIIPVEFMYFVMLCNAFCECTCKHESKRKSYESSERWFNNLRKTYKPTECQK